MKRKTSKEPSDSTWTSDIDGVDFVAKKMPVTRYGFEKIGCSVQGAGDRKIVTSEKLQVTG